MTEGDDFGSWDPFRASAAYWKWAARVAEIWTTRRGGAEAVHAAARARFASLVEFARTHSRFYRDAYRSLPRDPDPTHVPVVAKGSLMARFDEWVCDPELTLPGVEAFLRDRGRIGELHLGRYVIWKSSGSSGTPGIFVHDAESLATFDALMGAQMDPIRLASQRPWELMGGTGRAALVAATGEHFASIASWQRVCRNIPWVAARGFSILDPLPELVAALNAYRPMFLASYPTMLMLLADEQRAGRLTLRLARLWSGGECLLPQAATEIELAFGCPVVNEYGASECMSIAYACGEGRLHVHADWVLLEPVDADHRAVPPGEPSHTVLLSNLANRVQPIIRYDLGDSVVAEPLGCACGSPLPSIRVEGRRDEVVALSAANGSVVRLLPMALMTVVEEAAHVHRFQIVQTAPDRLVLRFDITDDAERRQAFRAAAAALKHYLAQQSLSTVRLALDTRAPEMDSRSGKLRGVIVAPRKAQRPRAGQ